METKQERNHRYYLNRREKAMKYQKERYQRIKDTSEFREASRAKALKRYYDVIKSDPERIKSFRSRSKKNTQSYRAKKQEVKLKLQALLGSKCNGCGIDDHRLLDFDHLDPKTKKFLISTKLHLPWETLADEVSRCQLLCANCHRLKTLYKGEFDSYIRNRNPN